MSDIVTSLIQKSFSTLSFVEGKRIIEQVGRSLALLSYSPIREVLFAILRMRHLRGLSNSQAQYQTTNYTVGLACCSFQKKAL